MRFSNCEAESVRRASAHRTVILADAVVEEALGTVRLRATSRPPGHTFLSTAYSNARSSNWPLRCPNVNEVPGVSATTFTPFARSPSAAISLVSRSADSSCPSANSFNFSRFCRAIARFEQM